MVPELFRAVVFAAECEDLYEEAHAQPFSAGLLAMSSLLAFWGIERVRAQAGIFVFCAVGKAGYAVCFFSFNGTSPLPCWQPWILRFRHASVVSPRP